MISMTQASNWILSRSAAQSFIRQLEKKLKRAKNSFFTQNLRRTWKTTESRYLFTSKKTKKRKKRKQMGFTKTPGMLLAPKLMTASWGQMSPSIEIPIKFCRMIITWLSVVQETASRNAMILKVVLKKWALFSQSRLTLISWWPWRWRKNSEPNKFKIKCQCQLKN